MEEGGPQTQGTSVLLKQERAQREGRVTKRQTRVMCLQPGQAEGTHHK